MKALKFILAFGTALSLAACAGSPMGPTVRVLPTPGKSFDQFQIDKNSCKQYANSQVRGQADAANSTAVLEGVGGTVLGAGLGAAVGGGHGAAVGAAGGAIAGTAVGASTSAHQQVGIQQQYNNAYVQCMVAKGNAVQQPVPPPPRTVIYAPPPTVIYTRPPQGTVIYTNQPPPTGYEPGPTPTPAQLNPSPASPAPTPSSDNSGEQLAPYPY